MAGPCRSHKAMSSSIPVTIESCQEWGLGAGSILQKASFSVLFSLYLNCILHPNLHTNRRIVKQTMFGSQADLGSNTAAGITSHMTSAKKQNLDFSIRIEETASIPGGVLEE